MRKRFKVNPSLSITPIESVKLPLQSRDELPAILAGLQWFFVNDELNKEIFSLIEEGCNKRFRRFRPPGNGFMPHSCT